MLLFLYYIPSKEKCIITLIYLKATDNCLAPENKFI